MLPKAYIVHQLQHRLRLRVPEMRLEAEFFAEIEQQIAGLEGITSVEVSEVTGSIKVTHAEIPYETLQPELEALELFELITGPVPVTPAREILSSGVSGLDHLIRQSSSGGIDLGTLAFTAVLGGSLYQIARGNLIGPAIPMLLGSVSLLKTLAEPGSDND